MSLQFRPGGFRPGELVCVDCRCVVDRLTIVDWHGENERFVCDDCHPGLAQKLVDLQRFADSVNAGETP